MAESVKKIDASKFKYRTDLENEVRNKYGLTPDVKANVEISGTREDLAKLSLSDESTFWGIRCVITDSPTVAKTAEAPDRGKKHDFGINQRNNKIK